MHSHSFGILKDLVKTLSRLGLWKQTDPDIGIGIAFAKKYCKTRGW